MAEKKKKRPGFFTLMRPEAEQEAWRNALYSYAPRQMQALAELGPESVGFGGLTSGLKSAARQGVLDKLRRVIGLEMGAGPLGKEVGQGFAEAITNPVREVVKRQKLTPEIRNLLLSAPKQGEKFTRDLLKRYQRILTGE